ncbi:MAG: cytochrome P450 [Opitutales bacterium]
MSVTKIPRVDLAQLEATLPDVHPAIRFGPYRIDTCLRAYHEHGPIFEVLHEGEPLILIAGEEANANTWGNPDDWSYHHAMKGFRDELGPLHLTQLDSAPHKRKRMLLNEAFSTRALMETIPTMDTVIVDGLKPLAHGETLELHHALMCLLTRVQAGAAIPCEVSDAQVEELVRFEEEFISAVLMEGSAREPYFARPDYHTLKESSFTFLRSLVADRRAHPEKQDLLRTLMDAGVGRDVEPLSDEELLDDTYLLLIAGHGNTAKVICRALHHSFSDDELLEALRTELAGFDGATLQGMDAFPLLKGAILESERLYPPAPILPRVAARPVNLLGFDLKPGTRVLHLHTLTHYLDELYETPFAFRPERWNSLNVRRERRNAHGVFGGGRHTCLGQNLARLHAPLVLGNILAHYTLKADAAPGTRPVVEGFPGGPETMEFFVRLHTKE